MIQIGNQSVSYEKLVNFIRIQKKLQAIQFVKTKMKLDLRESKQIIELIQAGKPDDAFHILKNHGNCTEPFISDGRQNGPLSSEVKNPFLIQEKTMGSRSKLIITIALLLILLAGLMAYLTVQTPST